jgi:D-alanyl-D-alanine carboxypeptidase/D-alanyl-D-alanine-endopeptidase (penicillin-binding protein 4)
MKKCLHVILFLSFFFQLQAQSRISTLLNSSILRTASYSYYAINANTGRVIQQSQQKSLVPASVMKIVTTAAALEIFGPQYRFKTQVGYTGKIDPSSGVLNGDLVIKGGCDPVFYSRYFMGYYRGTFENWADKIQQTGIKRIKGDLLIDRISI